MDSIHNEWLNVVITPATVRRITSVSNTQVTFQLRQFNIIENLQRKKREHNCKNSHI